jgi:D-alanyl-D-alanine carboxypeptidase
MRVASIVSSERSDAMSNNWPQQSQRDSFYGNPRGRNGAASPSWESANLVRLPPPFVMRFLGKPISGIRIHKKCSASLSRVLNAIWIASGKSQVIIDAWGMSDYAGAFNYRLTRGGSSLSSHSWGCAIDFDADRNGFGDSTPNFAKIPEVLKAFADEEWTWGGRWSKPDGMHWQAASV